MSYKTIEARLTNKLSIIFSSILLYCIYLPTYFWWCPKFPDTIPNIQELDLKTSFKEKWSIVLFSKQDHFWICGEKLYTVGSTWKTFFLYELEMMILAFKYFTQYQWYAIAKFCTRKANIHKNKNSLLEVSMNSAKF